MYDVNEVRSYKIRIICRTFHIDLSNYSAIYSVTFMHSDVRKVHYQEAVCGP